MFFAGPKCVQLIFRDSIQLRQPHSDLLFCLKLLCRSSWRFGASLLQLLLFAWPWNPRTFGGRACNALTSRFPPPPHTQSFCWHEYLTKPFCQIKMVKNTLTVLQKYNIKKKRHTAVLLRANAFCDQTFLFSDQISHSSIFTPPFSSMNIYLWGAKSTTEQYEKLFRNIE